MLQGTINIIAPPMGALLLEALPMQGVLSIDIVTAAIAITPLLFITIPQPEISEKHNLTVLHDILEGLRYTRRWTGLMIIFFLAILINFLFYPAFALMPLLVTDHFHGQALELGWLEGIWGIGIVIGGLVLGIWGGFKRAMLTPGIGLMGQGIGLLIVSIAPGNAFLLALGGMFFAGFMFPITNGPLQAVLQRNVAPEMQGRVFTLFGSLGTAMTPLSLMVAGPVADALGVRVWYVGAGLICLLVGLSGLFIPALLNLEADMQAAKSQVLPVRPEEPTAHAQPVSIVS
jgi:DHA3 family macrolide efflux protein-like MFS transporter